MSTVPVPSLRKVSPLVPGWTPPPAIAASVGLHAAALAIGAGFPSSIGWALGVVAANHAVLTIPTLHPSGSLLGPNITRLPNPAHGEMALTFDDGPHPEITPAVLDMLDARGARATFFCIGRNAAAHPSLVREIARRGHLIGNHSQTHPLTFSLMFPRALLAEIQGAQDRLSDITGVAPRFFRAPMGFRSPLLDPILAHVGLRLVTWTRRAFDTVERRPALLLRRLCVNLGTGDILLMHDANAAISRAGRSVTLEILPEILDLLAQADLRSVTLTDEVLEVAPVADTMQAAAFAA